MLSISELNELEAKFHAIKNKQKQSKSSSNLLKYLSILALFIALFVSAFNLFTKSKTTQTKEQNQSQIALLNAKISELNFKLSQAQQNIENEVTRSNQADVLEAKTQENNNLKVSEQEYLNLNHIEFKEQNLKPEQIYKMKNYDDEPTQILSTLPQKQKPKIILKPSKDTQNLSQNIDENFDTFIKLANKAYKNSEYQNALNYALKANELDELSEQSWLIFAKAKFKLGNKTDALRALESYNDGKNKKSVNLLIRQIKKDEL